MKSKYFIGIDIGGTKIAAAVVDLDGNLLDRQKMATPPDAEPKDVYKCVESTIKQFFKDGICEEGRLLGIGIGVPGIVDKDQHSILATPNINLTGFALGPKLEKAFGVKVVIGNDVNVGLMGEKWMGVAKNANDVVGLFWGTGLGGAVIINGQLVLGAKGAAAEIGHMIIDLDGPQSNIGIDGTLESYVSRWAVERDIRAALKNGKKTYVTEMVGDDLGRIKSKVLKECLRREDKVVTKIMQKGSEVLGKACVSVNHFLNPEMIVLGGGVIEACGDFILPIVKKIVKDDPFFAPFDKCKIVESKLGDDAVILGAVALVKMAVGVKAPDVGCFYPALQSRNGSGIEIDDKVYKKDVFIRADGKVKKLMNDLDSDIDRLSNKLGVEELRKVCKKRPKILFIGSSRKPSVELTKQAIKFLKSEKVQYKLLLKDEAISLYNQSDSRKAILICQR